MIPKIIHYIWFGRNPYPEKVAYCIESWKKHLPEYEFKLWNEDTFDIESVQFTKEAYKNKKWAFVSDYVRVYALYNFGGLYLDTDIEVLRTFNDLLDNRMVLGTDDEGYLTAFMASEKRHPFWKSILEYYESNPFEREDGSLNMEVNNTLLQEHLTKYGYRILNAFQKLDEGIVVFPDDYFHVVSLLDGSKHKTKNTYAIHWHTLLWISPMRRLIRFIRLRILSPLLGRNLLNKLRKLCNRK